MVGGGGDGEPGRNKPHCPGGTENTGRGGPVQEKWARILGKPKEENLCVLSILIRIYTVRIRDCIFINYKIQNYTQCDA